MPTNYAIRFSARFQKDVKQLAKRYRHIRADLDLFIATLSTGNLVGDKIQGTNYLLYKARVPNRDAQRGKSGGYRVIYYVVTAQSIVLVTIYAKSDQVDIALPEIDAIMREILDDMV